MMIANTPIDSRPACIILEMSRITKTWVSPDIECDGCARSIKQALVQLKGIESAEVHVRDKRVVVDFNADEVSESTLIETLETAGFSVEPA